MFLPLSLSIGFAMIISFFAAQMLVPVLTNWILREETYSHKHGKVHAHAGEALDAEEEKEVDEHLDYEKEHPEENDFFKNERGFSRTIKRLFPKRRKWMAVYFTSLYWRQVYAFILSGKTCCRKSIRDNFKSGCENQMEPLERTEEAVHKVIAIIDSTVENHISISSAYVGLIPSNYGTSNLYVFNSGTHEAVLQVGLDED